MTTTAPERGPRGLNRFDAHETKWRILITGKAARFVIQPVRLAGPHLKPVIYPTGDRTTCATYFSEAEASAAIREAEQHALEAAFAKGVAL